MIELPELLSHVDSLPCHVFTMRPDGRCAFINRALSDLIGRSLEQVEGFGWTDVVHEDDRDEVVAMWAKAARDPRPLSHQCRVRSPQGPIWISFEAVPVRAEGRGVGFSGCARVLPVQAVDCQDLAVRGVAHDLRNVLTALSGHLDLLCRDLGAPAGAAHELEALVARASEMTSELTEGQAEMAVVDVNELVTRLAATLRPLLRKELHLTLRLDDSVGSIHGYRGFLWRSLLNLFVNAVEAMPRGGEVVMESRRTTDRAGRVAIRLTVRDSGVGIAPDRLEEIFGAGSSTKGVHGRGLGLAVVEACARIHRGSASVESALGVGSAFHLEIPAHRGQPLSIG